MSMEFLLPSNNALVEQNNSSNDRSLANGLQMQTTIGVIG